MDYAGKVTEEKAESSGLDELVRTCALRAICPRVDTNDGDPLLPNQNCRYLVHEQPGPLEIMELRRTRERIARDRDVVVAEHNERIVELSK
jgi:hypothetical protein